MTEQRRLAAILVADVVGYSKLMGSDEAGTPAQLEALRTTIIEPQIGRHAGRLFKSNGTGGVPARRRVRSSSGRPPLAGQV
jgi:adenylate cyclase